MALGEEQFVGLAADFEGKLRMKNAILFIGRNMKEDVVRQIIGLYPWKIIATSRNTLPLEELQGIHIKIYSDEGDITAANLWKNDEFPVVYVWKKDESLNEEECQTLEITGESEEEYRVRRAQGMMKRLCKMIDNHNAMVVVGYAPETDNDMPYRAFATAVYNDCAIADNIQFWSEKSEETKLKKLADLKGIEFHTESLDEVLKARYEWNQSDEVKSNDSDAQYEIFYKNGKAVTISSREFLPYRKLAFVLTEQKVFAVRPYGKVMQAKWFYNFLIRSSADGPQWYGYLKNSDFHVSREFEIVLKCAVKRELLGEAIVGADKEMPIILCGAPGSSKSVALAALAYEIYSEHNNPVIFIDNDTLLFSDKSEEGDALKTLMEKIDACDGDARILLIWDCSSYRNVTSNAQHLSQMLLNRGRRFVLVCSAYEMLCKCIESLEKNPQRMYLIQSWENATFEWYTSSANQAIFLNQLYAWCAADPKFEGRSKTTLKRDAASMIEEYYTKGEKIKRLEGLLECIGRAPKLEDKIAELREEKALAERKAKEYSNSTSPWCFQDLLFKELEQKLRKTLDEKKCSMLPEDLLQYQVEAIAKGENSSS